jgi:hypothetical protein
VIADQVWVLKPQAPVRAVVAVLHGWGDMQPAGHEWFAHRACADPPLDAFIARYP